MTDKTLGAYQRTTPDPDETTGEALARLQAEMTRLLDEADAELRDAAEGGVTAALIEQEADRNADGRPFCTAEHDGFACSREGGHDGPHVAATCDVQNSICEVWPAAESRPLTPDAITDEMVERYWAAMKNPGSNYDEAVRRALAAALTESPKRPEGAEEIERLLMDADRDGGEVYRTDGYAGLADYLAEGLSKGGARPPEDGAA